MFDDCFRLIQALPGRYRPKADRYALFLLASLLDFELSGENGLSQFPIPSYWAAASVMVIAAEAATLTVKAIVVVAGGIVRYESAILFASFLA